MRAAVFIDGSNFYRKLKDLKINNTSKFNYFGFVKSLTKTDDLVYMGYYVGQIRKEEDNEKSQYLYSNQQKLFTHLESSITNLQIIRGHIQNFNGTYKEKGVDVRLALDIYKLANKDIYDKAILISSDSDIIPAIRMVQEEEKEVEYVGFSHKPSIALIKECKSKRLLVLDDVKPFEYQTR